MKFPLYISSNGKPETNNTRWLRKWRRALQKLSERTDSNRIEINYTVKNIFKTLDQK